MRCLAVLALLLAAACAQYMSIPGTCDTAHSKYMMCDGYIAPHSEGDEENITPDNTPAPWGFPTQDGFQFFGDFNPNNRTIIWFHGWNTISVTAKFGLPAKWVYQANAAGFNVLAFVWGTKAYDPCTGCPGIDALGAGIHEPCNAAYNLYKAGGAVDDFLTAFRALSWFPSTYTKELRFAGHSLGAQFALYAAYRMYMNDAVFSAYARPSRIDLIDPFMTLGVGGNRSNPFDGQVPPAADLPTDYVPATEFYEGSACHADEWLLGLIPPNFMSQYCQCEGFAWYLRTKKSVAMLDLSSIIGSVTANDFGNVMTQQNYGPLLAYGTSIWSKHDVPPAAWWFHLAPGTPPNGYDSSTDSDLLRNKLQKKKQAWGYNTVTLNDDFFLNAL